MQLALGDKENSRTEAQFLRKVKGHKTAIDFQFRTGKECTDKLRSSKLGNQRVPRAQMY